MFSICLFYLFLASSHQLYAELWLDSFSFTGPLGGVRTTTSLAMLLYLCLYCIFRLLSGCILLSLFRHLFTFLYICYLPFIFLCTVYPLWTNIVLLMTLWEYLLAMWDICLIIRG